jgi:hypothetical protein
MSSTSTSGWLRQQSYHAAVVVAVSLALAVVVVNCSIWCMHTTRLVVPEACRCHCGRLLDEVELCGAHNKDGGRAS